LPVAGWCAATAAGVAVASVALVPVLHTAVPDGVAPLAADNMHQVETAGQPAAQPGSKRPSPATSSSRPAASSSHSPTASPTLSLKPSAAPSPATVTYQDGWTVLTDASGAKSYLRTFHTGGGEAAIRIVPGTVSLVAATPAAGFAVDTTQNDPTNLVVVFHTATHSFTINALWWENRPYAQVSEVGS
jgi:hypothetical protein